MKQTSETSIPSRKNLFYDAFISFAGIIIGFTTISIFVGLLSNIENESSSINPFFAFVTYLIIPGILIWFYKRNNNRIKLNLNFPLRDWHQYWKIILFCILLMMGSSILYGILVQTLQIPWLMPPSPNDQIFFLGGGKSLFFNILIVVLWAPFNEELLFRNFLIPIISMKYRYLVASIISSILFSLMHLEPSALIPVFLLGICLAWLYKKSQSVWPCVVAHSLWNMLVIVIGFLI